MPISERRFLRAGQAANSGWPDSKCSVLGAHMALLSFDAAKVRRFHCGGRIFRGLFFDSSRFFLRGHVVMMVMVKMVKIEMEKKEKCSIIYNIYIFIYYSIKMAFPKIDFDQNDHDHFDHDTGAVQHRNLDSGVSHGTTLLQRHTLAGSLFGVLVCHIVGLL